MYPCIDVLPESVSYLRRSCPSDYIRHIHHAFIIIFETRHTGLIMATLNVLVKLLPSPPFLLSPFFFIGFHRFLSSSYFYLHLLNFLGYARGKYLVLQPRFYRLPRVRLILGVIACLADALNLLYRASAN